MRRPSTAANVFTTLGFSLPIMTLLPSAHTCTQATASAVSETCRVAAGLGLSTGAGGASCAGAEADTSVLGGVSGLFATAGVTGAGSAVLGAGAGAFCAAAIGGVTGAGRRLRCHHAKNAEQTTITATTNANAGKTEELERPVPSHSATGGTLKAGWERVPAKLGRSPTGLMAFSTSAAISSSSKPRKRAYCRTKLFVNTPPGNNSN